MKKILLFCILTALIISMPVCYAKKTKSMPDPLYLNSEVKNYEKTEQKTEEEPELKDSENSDSQGTINEYELKTIDQQTREKLHIKKKRKIKYQHIDKSNIPVTMDDYYKLSADKKRKDFEIPEPQFEKNPEIIMPDTHYRVISYNMPPGQRNIDLTKLVGQRTATSPGILSPDKTKMVYTQCYFYPRFSQTASSAYVIETKGGDAYDVLYMTNVMQGNFKPIVSVGMDYLQEYQYKTLFPIDFSKDSTKIAFKEKIGSNIYETWQTNVIIYDFKTKSWKRLTAVREAIIYWWRQNKQIELKDYMWDIFPIGWDKNNPERLIVYAYAFTKDRPLFLGTWSIDYDEQKSQLISIDSTDANIDLNGFGLKEIKFEN